MAIRGRRAKIIAAIAGLIAVVGAVVVLGALRTWSGSPIPVFGWGEGPEQPVAFPHTVHAGQLDIDCEFCHRNAAVGRAAGVPSVQECMFCHRDVATDPITGEARFAGEGVPAVERLRELSEEEEPIDWVRVHRLPDHAWFTHEPHVRFFTQERSMETQQVCSLCHGDVAGMTVVRQVEDLKMSDCVDCHRQNSAPTDCSVCHR